MANHPNRRRPVSAAAASIPHDHDKDYTEFLDGVRRAFLNNILYLNNPSLFIADTPSLFFTYIANLPAEHRQVHACNTCAEFLDTFGKLCAVDDDGRLCTVLWVPDMVPEFYRPSVAAMAAIINNAPRVHKPLIDSAGRWGYHIKGVSKNRQHFWHHLSIDPPEPYIYNERTLTPNQAVAAWLHKFENVRRALDEFGSIPLDLVLQILKGDHVDRAERFIGPVQWLRDLHRPHVRAAHRDRWNNLIKRAVLTAPDGYCYPRSSVVAPLLEGIAAGEGLDGLRARFNRMVSADQYQRPQVAPAAGNIAAAEKVVEKLGITASLNRRFARIDEIETIWQPSWHHPTRGEARRGVFAGVVAKGPASLPPSHSTTIPHSVMTWVKFNEKVLPKAERIQYRLDSVGPYSAFTTAVAPDAPPIFKWDRPRNRNPVSWYTYIRMTPSRQWNLPTHGYVDVIAVACLPNLWGPDPMPFIANGVLFILSGAVDKENSSSALFPELLINELHGARATIEAFSHNTPLQIVVQAKGENAAPACGAMITSGRTTGVTLRVLVDNVWAEYSFDRWD